MPTSRKTIRFAAVRTAGARWALPALLSLGAPSIVASSWAQDLSSAAATTAFHQVEVAIPMDDQGIRAAGIGTIHVEPDQGTTDLTFPGTVSIPPQQLRTVAAAAGGLVENMLVSPDEPVTAGQPLAQVRSPELVEAEKNYLNALSDDVLASDKLRRAQMLFEGKALPERELRVAESEGSSAKARLDERMQILVLLGMDKESIETLRTTRTIISSFVVKSPVTGTVVTRQASAGEQVRSAAPLYTIGEFDPLWINIQIPAHRLGTVAVGAPVSLPAYGVEGRIIRIGRTVDTSTQSAIAVAEVKANGVQLRPGLALTASVRIDNPTGSVASASKRWSVPIASVVRHRDQAWVFMKSTGGFRARPVQVINESARSVAIRADFRSDDEIAARGVLALLSELVDADKED
jgi:RND family efflux transporter MFP subunit